MLRKLLLKNYKLDIFMFVTATLSVIVVIMVVFILCKNPKLKILLNSFVSQQIKGIYTADSHEYVTDKYEIAFRCIKQLDTICTLSASLL